MEWTGSTSRWTHAEKLGSKYAQLERNAYTHLHMSSLSSEKSSSWLCEKAMAELMGFHRSAPRDRASKALRWRTSSLENWTNRHLVRKRG